MFDYSWIAAYVSEEMARKTMEQESLKMPISEADRDDTTKKWSRRLLRSLHCMWFADSWNNYQDVLKETIQNECKNFVREEIAKDSASAKKEAEHVSAVRGPTWGVDPAHGPDAMAFAVGHMKHGKVHWDYKLDTSPGYLRYYQPARRGGKTHTQRLYEELQAQETANRKAWAEWHAAVDAKEREAAKLQADKKREAAKDARKAENAKALFDAMKNLARPTAYTYAENAIAVREAEALIAMIEDVG